MKSSAAFFLGVYRTLASMKPVEVKIELDDQEIFEKCTSIMIHNTPYTGGGLLIAPDALMDDGLLDVIVVSDIGRVNLMFNFPRVYWGRHLSHTSFSAYKTSQIKITSEKPMPKIFDGDLLGTTPVDVKVQPKALNVVVKEN
jgi:diacylglycerol kinase family enzyme